VLDLDACFTVSANGRTITGSRLLPFPALSCGVLRARQGDELTITATGPDAEEGLEAIRRVLAAGTRFPDNRTDHWGTKNFKQERWCMTEETATYRTEARTEAAPLVSWDALRVVELEEERG
jgi:hypothetical protein